MTSENKPTPPIKGALRESDPTPSTQASGASAASTSGTIHAPNDSQAKRPLKSKKLDRTLAELETAFAAWDSLSDQAPAKPATPARAKSDANPNVQAHEQEFRSKTRMLLSQLRDQLDDLSDEK